MTTINARAKSVRQLLSNVKYNIDFYQRDYAWEQRHVQELIDDLAGRFLASYDPRHERAAVQKYPHYFLGTIVVSRSGSQTFIIDGQQRLTTLTLMLIFLNHRKVDVPAIPDVRPLIFSESYGRRAFNIDIPERAEAMRGLYEDGHHEPLTPAESSITNLIARYADIAQLLPAALDEEALPFFTDWIVENVDFVEIEAYSADDAFTIFETMNDRGVTLGPAAMLKGYLLANLPDAAQEDAAHKASASDLWNQRMGELSALGKEAEGDFFKTWLRAKYARTIRDPKRDAAPRDYETINRFHRWVRDERERIGLHKSDDFYDFIVKQLNRFAQVYARLRRAAEHYTPDLEHVYYNAHIGFTMQFMVALAPLRAKDSAETVERKLRLVTRYLDIYIARRLVNFRPIAPAAMVYPMFSLAKELRDLPLDDLAALLRLKLETMPETFDAAESFYLTPGNRRAVHYLLARMTHHLERESGIASTFEQYVSRQIRRPYEVEHIWPARYGDHLEEFDYPEDFGVYRDQIGGLLLLPRGFNQSFGALPYAEKVEHYRSQNLLAWSLHESAYRHNPGFLRYIDCAKLPFRPHAEFTPHDLDARQHLYRLLMEAVWSVEGLGVK
ncbi:MAG: DUF262 domain-containing protein [bacterium]|nr:DUF262 domain-containing protein [bacterium]